MATARSTARKADVNPVKAPVIPPAAKPSDPATQSLGSSQGLADAKFQRLLDTLKANRPTEDTDIVRRAWEFCVLHHDGQTRASGEPYVLHPLEVALVLAEMKLDATAIAAGLLHDAVEDTPVTTADITQQFGDQVAHIVEGVTKIDKIQFANSEDRQAENVRKMLLAMVSDVRVVLIKLADRLHNMRTLQHLRPERQQSIARETLDIYAPLAHRLGMGKVRGELEDLAFRYVDAFGYEQVRDAVDARRACSGASSASTASIRNCNRRARRSTRSSISSPSA
jgi:guanosine-3',5'-bis(diphosphate) 3'-pyrophosphohydrolase